ncbi:MAG: glycoside hydrolase family 97 C-terminal domain-containing protein [Bacteroidales bacterium]|nr:glycoside hydrolase family 97 C-terminal domain-containing protein [Bacteroidales bacterium]
MEYGGTFLNKRLEKRNGAPDSRGRVHGTIRRTSDAFQLAVSIIYQNPIQHFAITPNNLTDAPAIAIDFLRDVPTVWDETKLISGVAAEHVVLARRNGSTWYVAAINALEEPLKLDVNAIIEQLGGNARVLATQEGELRTIDKYKKPLTISQGDGAVIILK